MTQYGVAYEGKVYWPDRTPPEAAAAVEQGCCERCGAQYAPKGITTGYGVYENHQGKVERLCFACCAQVDRAEMILTGRAILYLTKDEGGCRWKISNWPGSLRFAPHEVKVRRICAGFCRVERRDVWWWYEGELWWGRGQGDNDLIRCRRTKVRKER